VDYVVKDGDVVIVDEFTGRLMEGRRWSDGLHQSVEAKEGIRPRAQNQTLATITFQNYFRLFSKLSGMTGTAMTEAGEFASIYDLDVVAIPPNRPVVRADDRDVIYLRMEDKWKAIASEIEEVHAMGQPVLVGTISIEVSELISGMLKRRGIPHEVLNAKQHDREAAIVSQAGRKGAVTVATNMAGRGTDIVLGGNPEKMLDDHCEQKGWTLESHAGEVKALEGQLQEQCATEKQEVLDAGGLYVLGTERHEARRIDNQLRGRSGRQGDPGRSRFFLSLDDDLMRRFYKDWVKNFLSRAGMGEGEPVESGMVSRAIEKAQRKVEIYHFEIRKNLLEYDEVMDQQRHLIYGHRQEAVENADMRIPIQDMFSQVLDEQLNSFQGDGHDQAPDWEGCASWAQRKWGWEGDADQLEAVGFDELEELLVADVEERMEGRREEWGAEAMGELERFLVLNAIDQKWKDHLYAMDALRAGVGLRGYAQVDPKNEYKREGLVMFESMLGAVAEQVTDLILKVQMKAADDSALGGAWEGQQASHPSFAGPASQTRGPGNAPPRRVVGAGYQPQGGPAPQGNPLQEFARQQADQEAASQPRDSNSGAELPTKKPARNAPCPCGSGKKFKQCCGRGGA